jgi:hypothetical protein
MIGVKSDMENGKVTIHFNILQEQERMSHG